MLKTPEQIQELQKKLYQKAKQEKSFRFYALYDKVYRQDIIEFAYHLVKSRKGAPGIDGITFEAIEGMAGGAAWYYAQIAEELRTKTYKPMPVKRVCIPKPDGTKRPLGISTIKDRVVQMAVKIIIEPIFEADFQDSSYGFRPGRSAHQAMDEVSLQLSVQEHAGHRCGYYTVLRLHTARQAAECRRKADCGQEYPEAHQDVAESPIRRR